MPPQQANHVWSREALLAKAQRYAEVMLEQPRDEWQFAFWSSLSLELLARAALANVSSSLLADSRDWNNLYYALGHAPTAKKFSHKSIDITNVFDRLQSILPGFTPDMADFGIVHMGRRNEELHSGSTPFDAFAPASWLPSFYEASRVLLESMGETLESFVGADEANLAAEMITASRDASAKAVRKTIEAHRTVWDEKDQDDRDKLTLQAAAWAKRQKGHRVVCPACDSDALVVGAPTGPPNRELVGDEIVETQYHLPSKFECVACGLKIGTLAQLHAAGLADAYKATVVFDAAEYYREDDPYADYEPDYNEP